MNAFSEGIVTDKGFLQRPLPSRFLLSPGEHSDNAMLREMYPASNRSEVWGCLEQNACVEKQGRQVARERTLGSLSGVKGLCA